MATAETIWFQCSVCTQDGMRAYTNRFLQGSTPVMVASLIARACTVRIQ